MANEQRGEVRLTLAGVDYLLRPTFDALAETEQRAGCGLLPMVRRLTSQEWGVRDLLAIIGPAIKAGGAKPPDNLGPLIMAEGPIRVAVIAAQYLSNALVGDVKNVEAPAVH